MGIISLVGWQDGYKIEMGRNTLVSVIIIFLNAEKYINEAIESVCNQSYTEWELLLVDDGSTDGSTDIARRYATQRPGQVHYWQHPGHHNCGKGASRNLGIRHARGEYIAFLDADDLWLPNKLAEQVAILDKNETVGMLYGETCYWYSWSSTLSKSHADFSPPLGVQVNVPIEPPNLLPLYLRGKAAVPCPSSILVRRDIMNKIGGFDETFTGVNNIYEDQAVYVKLCLETPVMVVKRCWDWYRQHPEASMAIAWQTGKEVEARGFFLKWTTTYLQEQGVLNREIWLALQREIWLIQKPGWMPEGAAPLLRWAKKWLLRIEDCALLVSVSERLRMRN
jgi:glycosyltransferase involved in cell wall biosynthesis